MSLDRTASRAGRRGVPRPRPRPRAELLELAPLDRVLAQLQALRLAFEPADDGLPQGRDHRGEGEQEFAVTC
jgi:hypothetical protein